MIAHCLLMCHRLPEPALNKRRGKTAAKMSFAVQRGLGVTAASYFLATFASATERFLQLVERHTGAAAAATAGTETPVGVGADEEKSSKKDESSDGD